MSYYRIWPTSNLSEIGKDPQIMSVVYPDLEMPRMHWHKVAKDREVDFDLKLPNVLLDSRAKFSDFLWVSDFSGVFVSVSNKVDGVFESFKLDRCQKFPFEAIRSRTAHAYKAIYLVYPRTEIFIDWTNSIFYKWQPVGHVWKEQLRLESLQQFEQVSKQIMSEEKLSVSFKKTGA